MHPNFFCFIFVNITTLTGVFLALGLLKSSSSKRMHFLLKRQSEQIWPSFLNYYNYCLFPTKPYPCISLLVYCRTASLSRLCRRQQSHLRGGRFRRNGLLQQRSPLRSREENVDGGGADEFQKVRVQGKKFFLISLIITCVRCFARLSMVFDGSQISPG